MFHTYCYSVFYIFNIDERPGRVYPRYQEVYEGESFNFSCILESTNSIFPVAWVHYGGTVKGLSYYKSKLLTVQSAEFSHSGRYSCFGVEAKGRLKDYFVAHGQLVVLGTFIMTKILLELSMVATTLTSML